MVAVATAVQLLLARAVLEVKAVLAVVVAVYQVLAAAGLVGIRAQGALAGGIQVQGAPLAVTALAVAVVVALHATQQMVAVVVAVWVSTAKALTEPGATSLVLAAFMVKVEAEVCRQALHAHLTRAGHMAAVAVAATSA